MKLFITGIAGFIGTHFARHVKAQGHTVSGCDSFNDYYDPSLKEARAQLLKEEGIDVLRWNCRDLPAHVDELQGVTHIIHLAAQAGVRHSLTHPESYIENNIQGTFGVLETCKMLGKPTLFFASSSSVYGLNTKLPFSEEDVVTRPANLYAATKLSNEHLAFSYHHLYGIPMCGFRFFTVYGSYGRPDMACYLFAEKIMRDEPLPLYNEGNMKRDFTHISDIVTGLSNALSVPLSFEVVNLGNSVSEPLPYLVECLESALGKKAHVSMQPMQPGEVLSTYADISKAQRLFGFHPKIPLQEGVEEFTQWFLSWRARA